jgi:CheY-like chemotaxis protein
MPRAGFSAQAPSLLIVEDDPGTRLALKRAAVALGWKVTEAATVADGLARLCAGLDCVILDLNLPDGRGESILAEIRGWDPPIRVVAVATGEEDAIRLGAVAYLRPEIMVLKPLSPGMLIRLCQSKLQQTIGSEGAEHLGNTAS